MEKINLKNMSLSELEEFIVSIGEKKFRAKQVYNWMYKGVSSFNEMKNISKDLKGKLEENAYINNVAIEEVLVSKVDGTRKYLFSLRDNNIIESVLMRYEHGNSVCVSSQVGCRMGCTFCASTIDGVIRNLSAGEILDQILSIQRDIGERVSNIVIMGSGEPFDNYDEIVKFFKLINSEEGLNLSLRNVVVSTCGIVPKIRELADEKMPVTLAISLHATNNEDRSKIMPINKKYPIEEVIDACKYYIKKTKRRVTFEYALIHGVNDTLEHGKALIKLLRGIMCHVNLIPLNKVEERNYETSKNSKKFRDTLKAGKIEATIRRELGSDINAACGQLRRKYLKEKS
ncbi:MAG: 23S rRNA (adenine(2503)-C(2))-methyltransferase RlmN [Anaeromicrobium sp.]|jgi:23S rRNA (adenine2503-C2)-methyltransferase|uniref:23S rRNA (adenine(2503)-C(2))-methyltransferase RlmN n=1 Tax=Anaeromicrobium sp. TaxID=1929132 RepID=UPI0025F9D567|nr:23S rRNA (adenine(2503)-C(2))-methyltransferase RlmN [Anaeromicrobium sp.]MCT4595995.1 23S rRNA (adenine(2503)-C(2))-methyltransferase RlmN [Anaeromicrobium sp.]